MQVSNKLRLVGAVMALSATGLIGIAIDEGFSDKAYKDIGGVLTNGFGNTNNVKENQRVSVVNALFTLSDNVRSSERAINECVHTNISQGQFDAAVSLAFNVGNRAVCNSTFVRQLNLGYGVNSCEQIMRWKYAAGKDCSIRSNNCYGIIERRKREYKSCIS